MSKDTTMADSIVTPQELLGKLLKGQEVDVLRVAALGLLRQLMEIVKLRLSSFQGFFLTNLGPRFLILMYRSILQNPDGGHIAPVDERIKGFVVGVVDQEQNLSFRLNPYLLPNRSAVLRNRPSY
jgi:hypothetical protein